VYTSVPSFGPIISFSLITIILIIAITIINNIICAVFVIMSHLFPQSSLQCLTALTILGKLQMYLTNFLDKDSPLSFHPLKNKCCSHLFSFVNLFVATRVKYKRTVKYVSEIRCSCSFVSSVKKNNVLSRLLYPFHVFSGCLSLFFLWE
jgi:hypothetical protein